MKCPVTSSVWLMYPIYWNRTRFDHWITLPLNLIPEPFSSRTGIHGPTHGLVSLLPRAEFGPSLILSKQTNGFQAKKRSDLKPSYAFETKPEKNSEDDSFSGFGLGLVKFIRNITRFSLGIIAAYTGFIAGNIQEQGTIDPNDKVFDIGCKFIIFWKCRTIIRYFSDYIININMHQWSWHPKFCWSCWSWWPQKTFQTGPIKSDKFFHTYCCLAHCDR